MPSLKTFYILTATQLFSLIGSRMTGIAVGIRVFQDTGDTAPLLIAAFFAELPSMIMGSFTGVIVDRWDRRHAIILGDVGQAAGTLLLLASFLSGAFALWHLYVAMLVQGIFAVIQRPAGEASITMLVPEPLRDRANGLQAVSFPLAGVVAPVAAGALYGVIGLAGVIAFDLLTFVAAILIVALIRIPRPAQTDEGRAAQASLWREITGGWAFLARRKPLLWMVIYLSFVFFLINGPLEIALPYLITLTGDEATAGVLLGAMNLGAFAGAATVAAVGRVAHRMRVILLGYFLLGALFVVYGAARHPLLIALTLFLLMFPLPFNGALFTSILQLKTPPDMQGRVFAITGQMFTLATPFSFLITAALVDHVLEPAVGGPGWAVVAPLVGDRAGAGIGLLLAAVGAIIAATTLAAWAYPGIRQLETRLPSYAAIAEGERTAGQGATAATSPRVEAIKSSEQPGPAAG